MGKTRATAYQAGEAVGMADAQHILKRHKLDRLHKKSTVMSKATDVQENRPREYPGSIAWQLVNHVRRLLLRRQRILPNLRNRIRTGH